MFVCGHGMPCPYEIFAFAAVTCLSSPAFCGFGMPILLGQA